MKYIIVAVLAFFNASYGSMRYNVAAALQQGNVRPRVMPTDAVVKNAAEARKFLENPYYDENNITRDIVFTTDSDGHSFLYQIAQRWIEAMIADNYYSPYYEKYFRKTITIGQRDEAFRDAIQDAEAFIIENKLRYKTMYDIFRYTFPLEWYQNEYDEMQGKKQQQRTRQRTTEQVADLIACVHKKKITDGHCIEAMNLIEQHDWLKDSAVDSSSLLFAVLNDMRYYNDKKILAAYEELSAYLVFKGADLAFLKDRYQWRVTPEQKIKIQAMKDADQSTLLTQYPILGLFKKNTEEENQNKKSDKEARLKKIEASNIERLFVINRVLRNLKSPISDDLKQCKKDIGQNPWLVYETLDRGKTLLWFILESYRLYNDHFIRNNLKELYVFVLKVGSTYAEFKVVFQEHQKDVQSYLDDNQWWVQDLMNADYNLYYGLSGHLSSLSSPASSSRSTQSDEEESYDEDFETRKRELQDEAFYKAKFFLSFNSDDKTLTDACNLLAEYPKFIDACDANGKPAALILIDALCEKKRTSSYRYPYKIDPENIQAYKELFAGFLVNGLDVKKKMIDPKYLTPGLSVEERLEEKSDNTDCPELREVLRAFEGGQDLYALFPRAVLFEPKPIFEEVLEDSEEDSTRDLNEQKNAQEAATQQKDAKSSNLKAYAVTFLGTAAASYLAQWAYNRWFKTEDAKAAKAVPDSDYY